MTSTQNSLEPVFLNFKLPPVIRESWADSCARRVWSPLFRKLSLAVIKTSLSAALEGYIKLERRRVPGWQIFQVKALAESLNVPMDIAVADDFGGGDRPALLFYDITYGRDLPFWLTADQEEREKQLLSACCLAAKKNNIWKYGSPWNSAKASSNTAGEDGIISIEREAGMNTLWNMFGLNIPPHDPCRFDCPESVERVNALNSYWEANGNPEELEQLLEILDWPVEWSAFGGIVEFRTPVVKYLMTTTPTSKRYGVRWMGNTYPNEGASGGVFPYLRNNQKSIKKSGLFNPDATESVIRGTAAQSVVLGGQ